VRGASAESNKKDQRGEADGARRGAYLLFHAEEPGNIGT
jgi:hypothetical protein